MCFQIRCNLQCLPQTGFAILPADRTILICGNLHGEQIFRKGISTDAHKFRAAIHPVLSGNDLIFRRISRAAGGIIPGRTAINGVIKVHRIRTDGITDQRTADGRLPQEFDHQRSIRPFDGNSGFQFINICIRLVDQTVEDFASRSQIGID